MLSFDTETGFEVSETTDVRDEVAQSWIDAFRETGKPDLNTDPETPQGQVIDSQTAAIQQKDSEVAFLANQFNPKTASGIWQDALAAIYFIQRKSAINSSATLTLSGRMNTIVPKGAQVRSSYDSTLWTLDADATIGADGTVDATFTCETEGAISAAIGTLDQIVSTVTGWDSVTNAAAATVGSLEESQSAFEARRYKSVALNSRGTAASVYARVAEVDDVIATYVVENKTNATKTIDNYNLTPHSIYVAVLGGDDNAVAEAIYKSCSAGCDYNGNTSITVTDENTGAVETVSFERPSDFAVYVKVRVQDIDLPDDYTNTIKTAVYNNFYGLDTETTIAGDPLLRVIMGEDVYASRFLPSILNAGIESLLTVQLSTDNATWADTVHIPIDGSPTLLTTNITVEVVQ